MFIFIKDSHIGNSNNKVINYTRFIPRKRKIVVPGETKSYNPRFTLCVNNASQMSDVISL